MTRDQFETLLAFVSAHVDEAVAMRSGYSHEGESERRAKLEQELEASGIIEEPMT